MGSQEEHFKSWEAARRRERPGALLLTFPILLALHRGDWWHWPPPAPLGTTVTPCAGERGRSGMEVSQQLCQHPSITPGLSLHPQPPLGNRPGPEIGHVGSATRGTGWSPDAEPSPQQRKPAIPRFPPQHSCHVYSCGNSGACLQTKGPLMYIKERTHACSGEDLQET